MDAFQAGAVVALTQVVTGIGAAYAARRAAQRKLDILGEFALGRMTLKFDKSDILALSFAIFLFWFVSEDKIETGDALASYTVVLTGTGVKELLRAIVPGVRIG